MSLCSRRWLREWENAMALTLSGYAFLSAGLTLALSAIALGNFPLLALAAVPLVLLAVGRDRADPGVGVRRTLSATRPKKGGDLTIDLVVTLPRGAGLVEIHQPLPEALALEAGTNLHLVPRAPLAREHRLRFRVRALAQGRVVLPAVEIEESDLLGLAAPQRSAACGETVIEIAPRLTTMQRVRAFPHLARRAAATRDRTRQGERTTDFLEMREYAWGDPPNAINWKATARRIEAGISRGPLVNESEREGRKTAIVFVECGATMRIGTTGETGLDHALDAASGVAAHLLDRGFKVGAVAYDTPAAEPIYPDSGTAQLRKIAAALAAVGEIPDRVGARERTDSRDDGADEGLARAVERARGFVVQGAPFIVVVTRLTRANAAETVRGVRVLRGLSGARGRELPVLVVHVDALALVPESDARLAEARAVIETEAERALGEISRLGARVIRWNPRTQDFLALLLGGRAP